MRILRAVVGPETAFVAATHAEMLQGRGVRSELDGVDGLRSRRCSECRDGDGSFGRRDVGSRLALSRPRLRRLTALSRRSLRPPLATMISTLKAERPGSRGLSEQQREGDH
jgi:hypothetical protein